MTHDHARNGTTSLFATFDPASHSVIGRSHRGHRHREVPRFLQLIGTVVPTGLDLHLVLDNYAIHKTSEIHKVAAGAYLSGTLKFPAVGT